MSSRRVVDAGEVVALLVQFAAARPDYVHEPDPDTGYYRYVDGDQRGCIVGRILHSLGATVEFVRHYEREGAHVAASQMRGVYFTTGALHALAMAQRRQDDGWMSSWVAAGALVDFAATRPDG
jgi:hypothetical protein